MRVHDSRIHVSTRTCHASRDIVWGSVAVRPGTRFSSASSGNQMRAASIVPSFNGINVCSITRTGRGKHQDAGFPIGDQAAGGSLWQLLTDEPCWPP